MTEKKTPIQPIIADGSTQGTPHLSIAATWKDPTTGALYVHQDLVRTQDPWAEEAHIAPMRASEQFGDVDSFVSYVTQYGGELSTFLTWNARGLRAVLDYASSTTIPGRCQWLAFMPFRTSTQWDAWRTLANGQPLGQKSAIERIEDLAADIVEPAPTDLMNLLRSLRATVNAKADTELRPDGTSKVAFERDARVSGGSAAVELPASFKIAIPVLKGHTDDDGRPVVYRLDVRIRVSVDDSAKLSLRFAIPTAERVLEDVYAERVTAAKALLGETFSLLRAAD